MKKKQKFFRGHRVHVTTEMPDYMSHFISGCDAIVEGSYRDQYGGHDSRHVYSLLILDENGNPRTTSAWYDEDQLTLVDGDIDAGENLLQKYNE